MFEFDCLFEFDCCVHTLGCLWKVLQPFPLSLCVMLLLLLLLELALTFIHSHIQPLLYYNIYTQLSFHRLHQDSLKTDPNPVPNQSATSTIPARDMSHPSHKIGTTTLPWRGTRPSTPSSTGLIWPKRRRVNQSHVAKNRHFRQMPWGP